MANNDIEVAIIGGGAAGIAAARHLHDAGVPCLLIEARERLGGRAWTLDLTAEKGGFALDLGCGWLHSADKNEWTALAETQGRAIDKTPPPWMRPSLPVNFPIAAQEEFREEFSAFHDRVGAAAGGGADVPVSAALTADGRWNALLGTVTTFIGGAEPDKISARDFDNYDDTGINFRVMQGYGATIAAHAGGVPVALGCPVTRIDRSGKRLAIETAKGVIAADRAIVALPSALLADEALFSPPLREKARAARDLPLGLADKLFLALEGAEEFPKDSRLFGATDRVATATYHMRPFGRPLIECYFGGDNAWRLERGDEAAFFDFAVRELTGLLGSAFARRVKPLAMHLWGADPFARGSYSYAPPGKAAARAALAAPVEARIYFAGEACSINDYSTAHGGYRTGIAAAKAILSARKKNDA